MVCRKYFSKGQLHFQCHRTEAIPMFAFMLCCTASPWALYLKPLSSLIFFSYATHQREWKGWFISISNATQGREKSMRGTDTSMGTWGQGHSRSFTLGQRNLLTQHFRYWSYSLPIVTILFPFIYGALPGLLRQETGMERPAGTIHGKALNDTNQNDGNRN